MCSWSDSNVHRDGAKWGDFPPCLLRVSSPSSPAPLNGRSCIRRGVSLFFLGGCALWYPIWVSRHKTYVCSSNSSYVCKWPGLVPSVFDKGDERLVTELLPLLVAPQHRDLDDEEEPYEVAATFLDQLSRSGRGTS